MDLAGWLLKESGEGYRYIRLPGMAERNDPVGRRLTGALWPSHFPQNMLIKKQRMMGAYDWYSMYQGLPRPPEGNTLKRKHFQIIENVPPDLVWVRFWDLAITEETTGDFTASLEGAFDMRGNLYFRRMIRGRWEWGDVRDKIAVTSKDSGTAVLVGVESNAQQKGMCQELWRDPELMNIGILPIYQHVDKRIRALPLVTRGEIGKLYLEKGEWNEEFIEECVDFPNGENDDQVDTATGCMGMLAGYYGMEMNLSEKITKEGKGDERKKKTEESEEQKQIREDRERRQRQDEWEQEQEDSNAAVFVG